MGPPLRSRAEHGEDISRRIREQFRGEAASRRRPDLGQRCPVEEGAGPSRLRVEEDDGPLDRRLAHGRIVGEYGHDLRPEPPRGAEERRHEERDPARTLDVPPHGHHGPTGGEFPKRDPHRVHGRRRVHGPFDVVS